MEGKISWFAEALQGQIDQKPPKDAEWELVLTEHSVLITDMNAVLLENSALVHSSILPPEANSD